MLGAAVLGAAMRFANRVLETDAQM